MQNYDMGNKEMLAQLEELVYDFLVYRKSKNTQSYNIQSYSAPYQCDYQIGRGWPYYKNLEYISEQATEDNGQEDVLHSQGLESKLPLPLDYSKVLNQDAVSYLKCHYGTINKTLKAYVNKALSEDNSVSALNLDQESLDKTVERIIEIVRVNHIEFNDQEPEYSGCGWGKHSLLRALVEALVLQELTRLHGRAVREQSPEGARVCEENTADYSRFI